MSCVYFGFLTQSTLSGLCPDGPSYSISLSQYPHALNTMKVNHEHFQTVINFIVRDRLEICKRKE